MALRKALSRRLNSIMMRVPSPSVTVDISPIKTASPLNASKTGDNGLFRRFFQRRAMYRSTASMSEFLNLPSGEKLKERLKGMTFSGDRLRVDGLSPPTTPPATDLLRGISVQDAKKLLKLSQLQKVKSTLRQIPINSISYDEFVRVCVNGCGSEIQGLEFAKMLDEAGNVIVLGNIVFLHPEQVAKSIEQIISQTIALPKDPRKKELDNMEQEKAIIDKKAKNLVKGELYCGLGFLTLQTLGFMRLTFWELSWDVMEPICFFVASLHFAGAYGFFLKTSIEPSFEGFFRRRFETKQMKLMKVHNFDLEKYNELCSAFYPNFKCSSSPLNDTFAGAVHP